MELPSDPILISPETSRTFAEYRFLVTEPKPDGFKADEVDFRSPLTKFNARSGDQPRLSLNLPSISAAMQSVSGSRMGIALAFEGGIADIYCSQSPENQAAMVHAVKRARAGFQTDILAITPRVSIRDARMLIAKSHYSNLAVTQDGTGTGLFLGVLNERSILNLPDSVLAEQVMSRFERRPLDEIVRSLHANEPFSAEDTISAVRRYVPFVESGATLDQARSLLTSHNAKFLAVVTPDGHLESMVFAKDIQGNLQHPLQVVDGSGRLLAAAAINTKDYEDRVPKLFAAGADVLFIDASNGFSEYSTRTLRFMREHYPEMPVVAGNYITAQGFHHAVSNGAWAVKIGIGGGSICITQEQKGIGRGQATALKDIAKERNRYYQETGTYIPLISDGGIVNAKDQLMAYAFGADHVMQGRWFAGVDESPTPIEEIRGVPVKPYWGEGSARARNWQRYDQNQFEEGVDGYVPIAGPLSRNLVQQWSKIRATMGDLNRLSLRSLHERPAMVELISEASMREGRVHDLIQRGSDVLSDPHGGYAQNEWGMTK